MQIVALRRLEQYLRDEYADCNWTIWDSTLTNSQNNCEIEDSRRWVNVENDISTYKRDLIKRIELINWVLENIKKPDVKICDLIEYRMNNAVLTINQTHDRFEADKLHSELRILDWIFYQVCSNEVKDYKVKWLFMTT